jgi:hypothetical protein
MTTCAAPACDKRPVFGSKTCAEHATDGVEDLAPLVKSIANRHSHQTFLTFDELVTVGLEVAAKAEKRYDPSKGAKLSTFAWPAIDFAMVRALGQAECRAGSEVAFDPLDCDDDIRGRKGRGSSPLSLLAQKRQRLEPQFDTRAPKNADGTDGDDVTRDWDRPLPSDPGARTKNPPPGTKCRVDGCDHAVANRRNVCAKHLAADRKATRRK